MSYHSTKGMRFLRVMLIAGLGILASACDLTTAPGEDFEVRETRSAMVEVLADDAQDRVEATPIGKQDEESPVRKRAAEE